MRHIHSGHVSHWGPGFSATSSGWARIRPGVRLIVVSLRCFCLVPKGKIQFINGIGATTWNWFLLPPALASRLYSNLCNNWIKWRRADRRRWRGRHFKSQRDRKIEAKARTTTAAEKNAKTFHYSYTPVSNRALIDKFDGSAAVCWPLLCWLWLWWSHLRFIERGNVQKCKKKNHHGVGGALRAHMPNSWVRSILLLLLGYLLFLLVCRNNVDCS